MGILNYLNLIKCAAAQLKVRNNRTRNNCSNSDMQLIGLMTESQLAWRLLRGSSAALRRFL
jgi:hypothetical protein